MNFRRYFPLVLGLVAMFGSFAASAENLENYLLPFPKKLEIKKQANGTPKNTPVFYGQMTQAVNALYDMTMSGYRKFSNSNKIVFSIDSTGLKPQGYELAIDSAGIRVRGYNAEGLFYGKQTLLQLVEYAKTEKLPLPCVEIQDWPDFEKRGFMLDISRDKVPTMKSLYHLIDLLSVLKINELQLYTEHTFAYKNHKKVWEKASPLTPKEIKELDQYCRKKFITLVPNQNSFGHMENWLKHDDYLPLAECAEDCKTIWGTRKRHSLNPVNPASFELMKGLYEELLPNFTSKYFNIGCDETVELGCGASKEACEKLGKGKIYLEFLKKLNVEVNKQGRLAQFWGDIILNHPELIPDVPKNMTALVWGYESNYPFEKHLPKFKNAGIDFYVCPGTSSWCSLVGRNKDAFLNLKNAATYGKLNQAKGYLITDWGDYGHWQPWSVSYPALLVGAGYAWTSRPATDPTLAFQLSHYVFQDATGNTAKALLKLGNSYLKANLPEGNGNAYHLMLQRYKWSMDGHFQTKKITKDGLLKSKEELLAAMEIFKQAKPQTPDSSIIKQEITLATNIAVHGIHLGMARLEAAEKSITNISAETKKTLAQELKPLIKEHKRVWVLRNRVGGLDDSADKLQKVLDEYEK